MNVENSLILALFENLDLSKKSPLINSHHCAFHSMKIIRILAILVLLVFVMMVYGSLVLHYAEGGNRLQILKSPILKFVRFPRKINYTLSSPAFTGIPDTYQKIEEGLERINRLDYDLYGLNSIWKDNTWLIALYDFRGEKMTYTWNLKSVKSQLKPEGLLWENAPPRHSLMLEDKDVIVQFSVTPNMARLDSNSNVKWVNHDLIYHHSLNIDPDSSSIWACGFARDSSYQWNPNQNVKMANGVIAKYSDDEIVKIDISTGKTLWRKSVTDILVDNGYTGLAFGLNFTDAIHLNDVQPALLDSEYWKKGDLFLSLRNKSVVILYRPSTNEVIKVMSGPFLNQHDVDIISSNKISIFSNNAIFNYQYKNISVEKGGIAKHQLNTSCIVEYDFEKDEYEIISEDIFLKEEIFTQTEGQSEILENGDVYIENQNNGTIYVIRDDEILLKWYFDTNMKGYVYYPNWIRLYSKSNI